MTRHPLSRDMRLAAWRRLKAEQAKRRMPAEQLVSWTPTPTRRAR